MEQDSGRTDGPVRGPITVEAALIAKPWGGRKLERFGFRLPPGELIGEAHLTGGEARVSSGPLAGQTLDALMRRDPDALAGPLGLAATGGQPFFPLLTKLIDAREVLSVQVHPGDAEAKPLGSVGKTEAWQVLEADVNSSLYLGLRDPAWLDDLALRARTGARTSALLREIPARPGETVLIPAGTIHALGGGVLVYEIQQPSGITYRFDDWGRVGLDGQPRELHIEESLAVANPAYQPAPIAPIALAPGRMLLTACRYFALERLHLPARQVLAIDHPGSPAVITLLDGEGTVEAAGHAAPIRPGQTVIVPPGDLPATVRTSLTTLTALHGWVPDWPRDIETPARAAGASDAEIARLAGPLG
jgi:mannose-6-phosphate isomerase